MDATPGNGGPAPFVPFTKAERIQQLGEIDESIVSLLRTVGQAIQSLGKKDPTDGDVAMGGDDDESSEEDEDDDDVDEETARQKAMEKAKYKGKAVVFKHEMNEFLRTLHSVNIRIKRQIWGLEEAGIVKLGKDDEEEDQAKKQLQQQQKKKTAGLEPDGNGRIGGINVGWLNTRSNKVERDMESELWDQAEAFLRDLLEQGEDSSGDSHMSQ